MSPLLLARLESLDEKLQHNTEQVRGYTSVYPSVLAGCALLTLTVPLPRPAPSTKTSSRGSSMSGRVKNGRTMEPRGHFSNVGTGPSKGVN